VSVVAISSPNGLGHVRRLIGILDQLAIAHRGSIELICERWQIERLRGWGALERLLDRGMTTTPGIMAPGVEWRVDRSLYSDENLASWEQRLSEHASVQSADLVLSDNLGAVAAIRPDVVLSGSFLWSDTLEASSEDLPAVHRFVERERALLKAHLPPMLCVEALATPGVMRQTDAVPLAWMCEEAPFPAQKNHRHASTLRVGIATGASSVSGHRIDEVARGLAEYGSSRGWTIATPSGEGEAANLESFKYQPADYAGSDLILCRPGTGALTQCVTYGVPILCFREPANPEMEHNASRVQELGIGIDLGVDPPLSDLIAAIENLATPARRQEMNVRLAEQPREGLAQAADWLAERLDGRLRKEPHEEARHA